MSDIEPVDPRNPHIVVVGGGISGLAAAWTLMRPDRARNPDARQVHPNVTILESDGQLGGKIKTSRFADCNIDEGPDAFLARVPYGVRLCTELGIDKQLVSPAYRDAFVWSKGRMQRLPRQTVLGVPGSLGVLARSKLISPQGVARASADLVMPAGIGYHEDDPTVAEVIGKRLGREVLDRLVDPLLGGINAGSVDRLSLSAVAPQLADIGDSNPSLLRATGQYLERRDPADHRKPLFVAPREGMAALPAALASALTECGVTIRTHAPLNAMHLLPEGRWRLDVGDNHMIADAVVLATPAFVTAKLIRELCPEASDLLQSIAYASVAMVRMAYRTANVERALKGTGYVVPAVDGRLVTACSWVSSKWEHQRVPGQVILRASVGRVNDTRAFQLNDQELGEAVHAELKEALGLKQRPFAADVVRWPDSFPQYDKGHADRVLDIERSAGALPGLALAGAAFHGLGIPSCIKTATESAEDLLGQLNERL